MGFSCKMQNGSFGQLVSLHYTYITLILQYGLTCAAIYINRHAFDERTVVFPKVIAQLNDKQID